MAPVDDLSPAGSSSYSSNTMYVGDGTWDATRNDFLLPNLVGLNFETMRYNGMGNRFAALPQYHQLVKAHAIVAVATFLFIVPAAIFTARFYNRNSGWAVRSHIYLQILTLGLSTVVFILGWFAVGPERSLTNPHHGIGLAIYVLVLVQGLGGGWIYRRRRATVRRGISVKLVLHQWIGRATALLAIAQIPLGLTLYGSPKFTFVLYTLWVAFLVILYFILSYRATSRGQELTATSSIHEGTVIPDRKSSRFGGLLAPLAAGAAAAALLGRRRNRSRSRSRSRSRRDEVVPSRRGSGSYIEEEKYNERRKSDGGFMNTALKGAAVLGVGALAKTWWDRRQRRKDGDDYSSVAPDTPSRHNRRRHDSSSEDSIEEHRLEEGRPGRPILPGPGNPVLAAQALSAAEPRPVTPRPIRSHRRQDSVDSDSYMDSTLSPSRRPQEESHKLRNSLLAGLGAGWLAKKWKDRRDKREQDRLDEERRMEDERRSGVGGKGSRFTGDGFPPPRRPGTGRHTSNYSSDLSSIIDDPHVRPGDSIPPIPIALGGAAAGAASSQSRSRHDITDSVTMPPIPHDPQGILHESGSEHASVGGGIQRRGSSRRRREGEAAAAAAVAEASALAAEEERRRNRSREHSQGVSSPPVSVKVKVHGDKDRNVTLRRLTEQEAAAEREARRGQRRRADSTSSLSGTDVSTNRRRYRRDERTAERLAESGPPPVMDSLSPPNPAFAAGRRPKDSAYFSGRPGEASGPASVGSPESHGTWSAMSPGGSTEGNAEERRRRRRLERGQRPTGTVDFS
ncbi:hypothetical protein B7494_g8384 [Chlorociboria aeruginascens]|nr:hypothetical protein B7494_g8384 [Chlorociboria aeruginascens]